MLSGLILSAGESQRMDGKLKALLMFEGKTFLERIMATMSEAGIGELVVVLGAEHESIERKVRLKNVRVVINKSWEEGQLSSLQLGIRKLSPESEGVLFTLVDHPLVKSSTYVTLVERWKKDRGRIVVPTFMGRKGHPTILPHRLYPMILEGELPEGARSVIRSEGDSVAFVPVDDPGVVQDVDTPGDYRRL